MCFDHTNLAKRGKRKQLASGWLPLCVSWPGKSQIPLDQPNSHALEGRGRSRGSTAGKPQHGTSSDHLPPKARGIQQANTHPCLATEVTESFCTSWLWWGNVFPWNSALQVPSHMSVGVCLCLSISEIRGCCSAAWAAPSVPTPSATCISQKHLLLAFKPFLHLSQMTALTSSLAVAPHQALLSASMQWHILAQELAPPRLPLSLTTLLLALSSDLVLPPASGLFVVLSPCCSMLGPLTGGSNILIHPLYELFRSVRIWITICGGKKKNPHENMVVLLGILREREASVSHKNWIWIYLAHPYRRRHRKVQADKSLLLPALVSEGRRGFLKSGQSPKCQIQGRHLKFSSERVRQRQRTVTMCHQPSVGTKARETTHQNSSWTSRYN